MWGGDGGCGCGLGGDTIAVVGAELGRHFVMIDIFHISVGMLQRYGLFAI